MISTQQVEEYHDKGWLVLPSVLDEVEIGVQVNGKMTARVMMAADSDESCAKEAALGEERVVTALAGKTVRKVIVVKGRLVNIVAN